MTASWVMSVLTRCVLLDAERTQIVQNPILASIIDVRIPVTQHVDQMQNVKLSITGPNAHVHPDIFPIQALWWLVSSNLRFVQTMLSVQIDKSVMESSAKMSASMTRLVARMKFVTMDCVRLCAELMMIVTARRFVVE